MKRVKLDKEVLNFVFTRPTSKSKISIKVPIEIALDSILLGFNQKYMFQN